MAQRRRSPILAGVLSLLTVGLGDAYNGYPAKGFRLMAAIIAAGVSLALLLVTTPLGRSPLAARCLLPGYVIVPLGGWVYAAARAWGEARRLRDVPRPEHTFRRCLLYVVGAVMLTLATGATSRMFLVQTFKIPSGAMTPTLQVGDHILVDKLVYGRVEYPLARFRLGQIRGRGQPAPGDVVVFIWPKDRSKDFIKRVIAVEGQTVEVRDKQVYVDGRPWDDPHAMWSPGPGRNSGADNYAPFTVPPGNVFVMGDNREQSYDSRFWGPVPVEDVRGRVIGIYGSWDGGTVRWDRLGRLVD